MSIVMDGILYLPGNLFVAKHGNRLKIYTTKEGTPFGRETQCWGIEAADFEKLVDFGNEALVGFGTALKEADKLAENHQEESGKSRRGLEVLGVVDQDSASLLFDGAASVTHPLLAEAVVQFNARACSELLPPAGLEGFVVGEDSAEKRTQAERVEDPADWGNWGFPELKNGDVVNIRTDETEKSDEYIVVAVTSDEAASAAARVLNDDSATDDAKTAAASALAQKPKKAKGKKK